MESDGAAPSGRAPTLEQCCVFCQAIKCRLERRSTRRSVGHSRDRTSSGSCWKCSSGLLPAGRVDIDDVTAEPGVIGQHFQRQRMVALAHSQEAAERHHGVSDLAGVFVDHKILHRPEPLALAIVDYRAFDLVGCDAKMTDALFECLTTAGTSWAARAGVQASRVMLPHACRGATPSNAKRADQPISYKPFPARGLPSN